MSNVPSNLKYAVSHEWAQLNSDGTVTVKASAMVASKSFVIIAEG